MNADKKNIEFVDRRRYPRFKVHYLADIYSGNEILYATVIDISEKGVGIMLPQKYYVDEDLDLRIRCKIEDDDEKKTDIKLKSKVIWIGEKNEKGMYVGGLEILEISEEDLEILRENIKELADRQLDDQS